MTDHPPVLLCLTCGHPEAHHDAGECWTSPDGEETHDETACPCSWAVFPSSEKRTDA